MKFNTILACIGLLTLFFFTAAVLQVLKIFNVGTAGSVGFMYGAMFYAIITRKAK